MRGKQINKFFNIIVVRITPADAGKTAVLVNSCGREKDHPRGCGENTFARSFRVRLMGSPPRMRGKRQ